MTPVITNFNNAGLCKKSAGSGSSTLSGIQLNNSGTFQSLTGTFVAGGGSSSGTFNAAAGALITFNAGTQIFQTGVNCTGAGNTQVSGGTVTINGSSTAVNFNLISGILNGDSNITISGEFTWRGGTMGGHGVTQVLPGAAVLMTDAAAKTLDTRTFLDAGSGVWDNGAVYTYNGSIFNILAGAQLEARNAVTLYYAGGVQTFFNIYGTLLKTAAATTTTISGIPVHSSGVVDVRSGTLAISGGSFTNTPAGTIEGGGVFDVTATTFSDSGAVSPGESPGLLTWNGAFPPTRLSTMNAEIGGLEVGTQYDRLAVTGNVTLDGNLNLSLINGFVPSAGDTFEIMSWTGSRTGVFASVRQPSASDSLGFTLDYRANGLYLIAYNSVVHGLVLGELSNVWSLNCQATPQATGYNVYRVNDDYTRTLIAQTTATTYDVTSLIGDATLRRFFVVTATF
jgi:hypothetical protein